MNTISFWRIGFRPFFLLGLLHSLLVISIWIAFQIGLITFSFSLHPIDWHAHEMLYGFTTAIVTGFLLTATQNWTGIRGIHGNHLIALVALWLVARALSFFPSLQWLFIISDLAFYPCLAISLLPYLKGVEQRRNQIFFLFFSFMFFGNLLIHFGSSKLYGGILSPRNGYYLALHTIIAMIILIGGRVIPFFTEKAISNAKARQFPWLEKTSIATILVFIPAFFFSPNEMLVASLCFFTCLIHFLRWVLWNPYQSIKKPILLILYIGYLWIPLGFLLYGFSLLQMFPLNIAAHAFAIGALGIIVYGMVNRVSLGHTGRVIHASPYILIGYVAIFLSPLIRVFSFLMDPALLHPAMKVSGTFWIIAYAILFTYNLPILLTKRIDGKDG